MTVAIKVIDTALRGRSPYGLHSKFMFLLFWIKDYFIERKWIQDYKNKLSSEAKREQKQPSQKGFVILLY